MIFLRGGKKYFFKSSFTSLLPDSYRDDAQPALSESEVFICINSYHQLLNRIPGVEECDATKAK